MKFKMIAAACAALCSASAFAAPLNPATTVPEVSFFIAGASAQNKALQTVAADLFDTSANEVVVIKQSGSSGNAKNTTAWLGKSKAELTGGVSKIMYVVYNNEGGSNAGVKQVLTNDTTESEANVVKLDGTCTAPALVSGVLTSTCSNAAPLEAAMALSDVTPQEAVPGVLPTDGNVITVDDLIVSRTALQGFGVAVNAPLYAALQAKNIREELLPASCQGSSAGACQPSIRRADYASLATNDGSIKDAASLLRTADNNALTLVRRVDSSGTQAASNIFFANSVCGIQSGTNLVPASSLDFPVVAGAAFGISEQGSTSGVKSALNNNTGYKIGVMSLENIPGTSDTFRFVKIDNVSPNFNGLGVADSLHRKAIASGDYSFAFEMTAMYRNTATEEQQNLANTIIAGLTDSTKHNLAGIAYLDGTDYVDGKAARVTRYGNNCKPAIN